MIFLEFLDTKRMRTSSLDNAGYIAVTVYTSPLLFSLLQHYNFYNCTIKHSLWSEQYQQDFFLASPIRTDLATKGLSAVGDGAIVSPSRLPVL